MSPTSGTTMTIDQAIAAFEAAEANLNNDNAAGAAAQAKADAANAALANVNATITQDQAAYTTALQNLVTAAQAILTPPAQQAAAQQPAN